MTHHPSPAAPAASTQVIPTPVRGSSLWDRVWSAGHFLVALASTTGFLVYLLMDPFASPMQPVERVAPPEEIVTIQGPR